MPSGIVLLSLCASCAPLLIFHFFLDWLGRTDRESFTLLLCTLLWGAIGATFFGLVGTGLLDSLLASWHVSALGENLVAAPLAEELAKGLVLLALFLSQRIRCATNGLFYGAATGLGFAMTENCLYFLLVYDHSGPDEWYANVIVRTLFATSMHVAASSTLGFFLGNARERRSRRAPLLLAAGAGLLAAFAIHALWNGTVFVGEAMLDMALPVYLFLTVPFIAFILLLMTELALRSEGRILLHELTEEARAGLIPHAHPPIIARHDRRRGSAWLGGVAGLAGQRRDRYVRALCDLALSKHAARLSGADPPRQQAHIAALRDQIRNLTAG